MDDYGKPDAVAAQGIGAVQKTPDMAQQQFMSPVNTHPDVSAQPDVNTPLDINIPPVANTPPGRVQPQNSDQAPYQVQIQNRLPPCYQNQPQYYNPLPPPPYSGGPEGDTHSRQYVDVHYPRQYGYPPAYTPYGQPAGSGKATASMVLGIIALVFSWMYVAAIVSIPCGIVGLILGVSARRTLPPDRGRGQATAGMVCSIIALVLSALIIALAFIEIFVFAGINMRPSLGV